jgi:polar amino acid transport system substrate-binding protein
MRPFRPALILAGALLASIFTACGTTNTNTVAAGCVPADGINTASLNLVLPGKLTDATDATYPPQEFVDPTTHTYTGMEVDLANEFAKRLCLVSNVQNVQFNTIIAGITSSSKPGNQYYDMSISAFTITKARKAQVDMIPYFTAGESLLVPQGNPHNIKSKNDLCGLQVAVESGTVEEAEIKNVPGTTVGVALNDGVCKKNPVKLQSFATEDQVISALNSNSVDATYQDSPVSGYYNNLNGNKFTEITTVSPNPEGIVVRNDNSAFENAIKQVLTDMENDGTYDKILSKWGLTNGACKINSACYQQGLNPSA